MTAAEQYRAATEGAAVFDVSDLAVIEVTGGDRVAFLHNFCTNDIKTLRPGEGCEAFVTNAKGRVLGHVLVFAAEDAHWIVSEPGTQTSLLAHLDRYVITEDVGFRDLTPDFGRVLVCGPDAHRVLSDSLAAEIAGVAMCGAVSVDAGVLVRRVPYVSAPAYLVRTSRNDPAEMQDRFVNAGAILCGAEVLEVLRIEAAWPRYGVDISEEHIAQEAGRTAQAISFTKGCYLGQEPIARLDSLGHTNRELRGIRFESPGEIAAGAAVRDAAGANEVGTISSVAIQPVTNCPVALGMLKTAANAAGTRVRSQTTTGETVSGVVYAAAMHS